jgi:hypothetical protein
MWQSIRASVSNATDALVERLDLRVVHKRVCAWYRIRFSVRSLPDGCDRELIIKTTHEQEPVIYHCAGCGRRFIRPFHSDKLSDQFHNTKCYNRWLAGTITTLAIQQSDFSPKEYT